MRDAKNSDVNIMQESPKICFHWLLSPIHLMINKEMLNGLSLRTYIPESSEIVLQLNLSEICLEDTEDVLRELNDIEK